ncbi:MAG: hypothetical protein R3E68_02980 [Burkholderiaceae bacterium]
MKTLAQIRPARRPLLAATLLSPIPAGCGGGWTQALAAWVPATRRAVPSARPGRRRQRRRMPAADALAAINGLRAQPRNCGSQLYPAAPALAFRHS